MAARFGTPGVLPPLLLPQGPDVSNAGHVRRKKVAPSWLGRVFVMGSGLNMLRFQMMHKVLLVEIPGSIMGYDSSLS